MFFFADGSLLEIHLLMRFNGQKMDETSQSVGIELKTYGVWILDMG